MSGGRIFDSEIKKVFLPEVSKRELFAAMALQGLVASGHQSFSINGHSVSLDKGAVALADALIAELERSKK